ncbi:hypothetical protein, partial [Microseira wollei]|uniref:hypothetical protein n=1 Tax=Microseira wollei TaxID=467598 RepID=UPI001CFEB2B4
CPYRQHPPHVGARHQHIFFSGKILIAVPLPPTPTTCRGTAAAHLLPFAKDLNCRAPTANTHHMQGHGSSRSSFPERS